MMPTKHKGAAATTAAGLDEKVAAVLAADEAGVATAMRVFEAAESTYYAAVSVSRDVGVPIIVSSSSSS